MDFFISPAYSVPPMMTILRIKFTMMNTSLLSLWFFRVGQKLEGR